MRRRSSSVWALVFAGAVACGGTPSESNCGNGSDDGSCIASSEGSTGVGMTTFMTTAPGTADETGPSTTASSASGASTTGASTTTPTSADGTADTSDTGTTGAGSSTDASGSSDSTGEPVTCSNDVIDAGEQCDGIDLGGADCVSQGFADGVLGCAPDCSFDTTGCAGLASCGNGVLDVGEQCDAADLGGAECEDAGDQFGGGTLGCDANCGFDTSGCCVTLGQSCAVHDCCSELRFCGPISGVCV